MSIETPKASTSTFELPIGLTIDGVNYKSVILTEMTGIDEDILTSQGHADQKLIQIFTNRIAGFVGGPGRLTQAQVASISAEDAEYMMICLRRLTYGDMLSITSECTCGYKNELSLDLSELELYPLKDGEFVSTIDGHAYKFRISTLSDQAWVRDCLKRLKLKEPTLSLLMLRFIESVDGESVSRDPAQVGKWYSRIQGLSAGVRTKLRDAVKDLGGSYQKTFDITCADCGKQYQSGLRMDEGFFSESGAAQKS